MANPAAIPEGYHTVTPYLIVDDAAAAIDFYQRALGATELYRLPMKDANGRDVVGHAEIRIGDSTIMLSDEWPDMQALGPKARGGATSTFMIYCDNADHAFQQALDAGATADKPVEDQFWGDRMGTVVDPFGHKWTLATHVEDVPPEELKRRMDAWSAQQSG
ncbi:VOC family protein [Novilysobacter spongiicola]|uniref:PhnB protein n=1 Tax=Lysobacter spongiicola DSM 21749 TaxID=1122188 RepID=A0A1T4QZN8_9GAMM|nr:VOC family protein [Lysobacter spongiicola]SKA09067.1 PhnB protein [Lysobacter spongiicola DSM 21749]